MITTKEIKENKIDIVPADNVWGYKVYQEVKGISKERSIFMLTTQRFKNGTFKAYPAVSVMINVDGVRMQRIILFLWQKENNGNKNGTAKYRYNIKSRKFK